MRVVVIIMLAVMSTGVFGQTEEKVIKFNGVEWVEAPVDSVKVPKSLIEELSTYVDKKIVEEPINIGTVRTAGLYALSVVSNSGFGGRELLISLQNSPYDEEYFSKGLLVGQNYVAEIRTNYAGEQIIVFKRKR